MMLSETELAVSRLSPGVNAPEHSLPQSRSVRLHRFDTPTIFLSFRKVPDASRGLCVEGQVYKFKSVPYLANLIENTKKMRKK